MQDNQQRSRQMGLPPSAPANMASGERILRPAFEDDPPAAPAGKEAGLPATRSEEEWTLELLERGVIVQPGHFYDFPFGPLIVVSLIQTSPKTSAVSDSELALSIGVSEAWTSLPTDGGR